MKIGGGLLAHADHFEAALEAIGAAGLERRLLVVPGGGPFADAVRDVDRRLHVSATAAHWMAVLALDQYAHMIAERLPNGRLVDDRQAIETVLDARRLPVLAPFRWMREVDPLPHTWDATSDSIAAWVAGAVGAWRLVLVKPAGARRRAVSNTDLVDAHFSQVIPTDVEVVILGADQRDALCRALQGLA